MSSGDSSALSQTSPGSSGVKRDVLGVAARENALGDGERRQRRRTCSLHQTPTRDPAPVEKGAMEKTVPPEVREADHRGSNEEACANDGSQDSGVVVAPDSAVVVASRSFCSHLAEDEIQLVTPSTADVHSPSSSSTSLGPQEEKQLESSASRASTSAEGPRTKPASKTMTKVVKPKQQAPMERINEGDTVLSLGTTQSQPSAPGAGRGAGVTGLRLAFADEEEPQALLGGNASPTRNARREHQRLMERAATNGGQAEDAGQGQAVSAAPDAGYPVVVGNGTAASSSSSSSSSSAPTRFWSDAAATPAAVGSPDKQTAQDGEAGEKEEKCAKAMDGCQHYSRRCRIVAPCCGGISWCRHCHRDETDHELDRKAIKEIICSKCNLRQPGAERCRNPECNTLFGNYYCDICNFWDDEGLEKLVFHCTECSICRIGGRDNYFHCETCACCYPLSIKDSHRCVANAMNHNCPVCLHDLFQSTTQVTILLCGHTIHQSCLGEMQRDYSGLQSLRCPICNASLYNYEVIWRELDRQVESHIMPEEFRNIKVNIICNDCHKPSEVPFHVIGHKCTSCLSYNTRRL